MNQNIYLKIARKRNTIEHHIVDIICLLVSSIHSDQFNRALLQKKRPQITNASFHKKIRTPLYHNTGMIDK